MIVIIIIITIIVIIICKYVCMYVCIYIYIYINTGEPQDVIEARKTAAVKASPPPPVRMIYVSA